MSGKPMSLGALVTESEEPLLTRNEVAEKLGQELRVAASRVLRAVAAVRTRIETVPGERNGRVVQLYDPEAVELIRRRLLRGESRRELAKDPGALYWRSLAGLRVTGRRLGKLVDDLYRDYAALRLHPAAVSATIHTLPEQRFALVAPPVLVLVSPLRRSAWRAVWPETGLQAKGQGQAGALLALRQEILATYLALREDPEKDPERWAVLEQLIRERRPRKAKAQAAPSVEEPHEDA